MTTISLELAKELQEVCKEKGKKLWKSEFYWKREYGSINCWTDNIPYNQKGKVVFIAPAYTLDELLEWLFAKTKYISIRSDISPKKGWTAWCEKKGWMIYQEDTNPANAACKLLIWLIKNGLI